MSTVVSNSVVSNSVVSNSVVSNFVVERPEPVVESQVLGVRVLMGLIRLYQTLRRGRPSPCRYLPSCSEYAAIAVQRHGATRGSWLAARRLCRCHPWGGYGADPVPERSGVRNPS